jgi:hypothetical protein
MISPPSRRISASRLILVCLLILASRDSLAVDTIPVHEIKVGMKGYALTVFQGTAVEQFPVEVVGIYPNFVPQRSVILVRLSGKAEFTGVVAGMSGSPVFLEGRLAGALAYRFMQFEKEPIAGVTPIAEMLAVKNSEQYRDKEEFSVPVLHRDSFHAVLSRDYSVLNARLQVSLNGSEPGFPETPFKPLPMLLTVSGAGDQTLRLVRRLFPAQQFEVAGGGTSSEWEGGPIAPGSPLAVVLLDGDLGLAATGTVTHTDGNEVFGFGHPFFEIGPTRLPMAQSTIIYTMSSEAGSFKLAAPGMVVGTLRQDRFPAVYGTLGPSPPMIPITLSITLPWGQTRSFSYRLAEDYRIYGISPILGLIALINSMESARESFGENALSADILFRIKNFGELKLSDFYGGSLYDLPGTDSTLGPLAFDFFGLLSALYANGYEFINLDGIDIHLKLLPGRRVAEIESVETPRSEAHPGDAIPVFIKIRPFMKPAKTLKFTLKIPEAATEGNLRILIGDSSAATRDSFRALGNGDPRNFREVLRDLRESLARRRDRLYVRFTRPTQGLAIHGYTLPDLPPSVSAVTRSDSAAPIAQVLLNEADFPLDYEIVGSQTIFVRIKKEV